jgi:hypothetical protein
MIKYITITTLQNQGGIFKRVSSSRYPDISVKDTLVMDVLVTDISVTGHFGNRHFGNRTSW